MFAKQRIDEERSIKARKKQIYGRIGVFLRKKISSALHLKTPIKPSIRLADEKKKSKGALFTLADGSTNFINANNDLAMQTLKRLIRLNMVIAILTIINFVLWSYENDLYYKSGYRFTKEVNLLRSGYLVLSLVIAILIIPRKKLYIEYQKHRGEIRVDTNIFQRSIIIVLIAEIIYNAIAPIPNHDQYIEFSQNGILTIYSLDDFLYVISFPKLYWVSRVFKHASPFNSPKAYDICKSYHREANFSFALRAHIHKNPFLMESFLTITVVFLFCFPLKVFERSVQENLEDLMNSIWILSLVVSTIGYGDLVPVTDLGRVMTATACYLGVFFLSLMIYSLTNYLTLSGKERHAYDYIEKGDRYMVFEVAASDFIKKFLLYSVARNSKNANPLHQKNYKEMHYQILVSKKQFQSARLYLKQVRKDGEGIIQELQAHTESELNLIKSRIKTLNVDKYEQCCEINNQAKDTFLKANRMCGISDEIVQALENVILEDPNPKKAVLFPDQYFTSLEMKDETLKQHLQRLKRECFAEKLITHGEFSIYSTKINSYYENK